MYTLLSIKYRLSKSKEEWQVPITFHINFLYYFMNLIKIIIKKKKKIDTRK
jgi:hypothetical protein